MANTRKTAADTAEKAIAAGAVAKQMKTIDVDLHQPIPVISGFHGLLHYNARSGETLMWTQFGDIQYIELGELRNAKGSAKNFFVNNWFMFDEDYQWVIDFLGLRQCYENTLNMEQIENLYEMTATEIEEKFAGLPQGQKQSIAFAAREMIEDGRIDSRKVVAALEKSLGIRLVESEA